MLTYRARWRRLLPQFSLLYHIFRKSQQGIRKRQEGRGFASPLLPCQPLAEERIVEGSLHRRPERHIVHPGPARAAADAAAPTGPAAGGEPPARIRLPVQRPDVHRLTFVNSYPCGPSERQPHLVPHHVPVGGLLGHALVHEAEPGVVVDEPFLSRVPRLNAPMGTPRPHVSRHVSGRAPRRGRRP